MDIDRDNLLITSDDRDWLRGKALHIRLD